MLICGHAFVGESRYFNTERRLRSVTGTGSWFTEFRARNFKGMEFIFQILKLFLYRIFIAMWEGAFPHV
jgi:hypothetical protein